MMGDVVIGSEVRGSTMIISSSELGVEGEGGESDSDSEEEEEERMMSGSLLGVERGDVLERGRLS